MKSCTLIPFFFIVLLCGCSPKTQPIDKQPNRPINRKQEQLLPPPSVKKQVPDHIAYAPPIVKEKGVVKPKPVKFIVIDAGHGGEDFGTHSIDPAKYHEKHLTLSTAMMLNNMLLEMGYQTMMTRNHDFFIPLKDRAKMANQRNTALFVSIHFNSAPSREAHGIEVYYYDLDKNEHRRDQSKVLANYVLKNLIAQTQAKSRGVKHGNLLVVRETTMPAILVECGFMTNVGEMEKLKNAMYLKKIALGIAQGIQNYLNN